jgi:hypothetical protein
MSETKELLRRGVGGFEPMPDAFDRVLARRDRKQRNQRVAAGVLGIAVFALATIGFVRLLGSDRRPVIDPAVSPSPPVTQPSPPFTARFDSPLHGLSIGYPARWLTRAATEPWGHGEITFGAPDVDVIFDPTFRDDLYLALVSEPLGDQSEGWVSDVYTDYSSLGICKEFGGGGGGDDTLDGNYGWFEYCDNDSVAIIRTATRGYIIYLHVGDEVPATYPVPDFEGDAFSDRSDQRGDGDSHYAVLETLDLRPEDAVDASNP